MIKAIGRTFGRGVIVLLPIVITVYVIWVVGSAIETAIRGLLELVAPDLTEQWYYPGLGLALGLLAVFGVGLAMRSWLARCLWIGLERLIDRIPLVASLYSSLREMMGLFSGEKQQELGRVVMVNVDEAGTHRVIGFVTREQFDDLPEGVGDADRVAVYLPMSYQLGGYTTIVPRDKLTPVDMPVDRAMRFALFAGVQSQKAEPENAKPGKGDAPKPPEKQE